MSLQTMRSAQASWRPSSRRWRVERLLITLAIGLPLFGVAAQGREAELSAQQLQRLDVAVEKGLQWLARHQQRDGSLPSVPAGQPGVTCLAALGFLSAGHVPDSQPFGKSVRRALQYALDCERQPGFFTLVRPSKVWGLDAPSHTGYYNQAIAALALAEASGELTGELGEDVIQAVERAVAFTMGSQAKDLNNRRQDEGGWRYPVQCSMDNFVTDLSVTAWQVTFLRSAKNAGYDIDQQMIDAATNYVRSLYKSDLGTFTYAHTRVTRSMTGAGIMSMAMLGEHRSSEALAAAEWLDRNPLTTYGQCVGRLDRFQYCLYYCTQGTYHLGDEHFSKFFPRVVDLLVENQKPDGSWPAMGYERPYGTAYATAMSVLSLTTHYAMLPIHQR